MTFTPRKRWMNRDRFVLSMGHASALYYTMLHLSGNGAGGPYEVSMDPPRMCTNALRKEQHGRYVESLNVFENY